MALPPLVAEGLITIATSDRARDFAQRLGTSIWGKIFDKAPSPPTEVPSEQQILDLVRSLPTEEELATAFAALETRLNVSLAEQAAMTRRWTGQLIAGLAVIQLLILAAVMVITL